MADTRVADETAVDNRTVSGTEETYVVVNGTTNAKMRVQDIANTTFAATATLGLFNGNYPLNVSERAYNVDASGLVPGNVCNIILMNPDDSGWFGRRVTLRLLGSIPGGASVAVQTGITTPLPVVSNNITRVASQAAASVPSGAATAVYLTAASYLLTYMYTPSGWALDADNSILEISDQEYIWFDVSKRPFDLLSVTPGARPIEVVQFLTAGNFSDGDTVNIFGHTYTMQSVLVDSPYNVLIGATIADSLLNLGSAFTGGASPGLYYGSNTPSLDFVATSVTIIDVSTVQFSITHPEYTSMPTNPYSSGSTTALTSSVSTSSGNAQELLFSPGITPYFGGATEYGGFSQTIQNEIAGYRLFNSYVGNVWIEVRSGGLAVNNTGATGGAVIWQLYQTADNGPVFPDDRRSYLNAPQPVQYQLVVPGAGANVQLSTPNHPGVNAQPGVVNGHDRIVSAIYYAGAGTGPVTDVVAVECSILGANLVSTPTDTTGGKIVLTVSSFRAFD